MALSEDSELDEPATKSPNLIKSLCNSGLHAETALSEAKENLGPGTDTTSATLAHILWALAQNPDYQKALYEDLAAVSFSTDMTTLESVPRLQACVKEGIRWAGAAAAMLPRIVPPRGIELHGRFIPEGVSEQAKPVGFETYFVCRRSSPRLRSGINMTRRRFLTQRCIIPIDG